MSKQVHKTARNAFHDLEIALFESGDNLIGDCPFCDKVEHFGVKTTTGEWNCFRCGRKGSLSTFMSLYTQKMCSETSAIDWEKLEKDRGIPAEAFKQAGMGWDGAQWLLPVKDHNGVVRDVRRYRYGGAFRSTSTCKVGLLGIDVLARALKGLRVWLCEGQWDGITLRWVLGQLGHTDDVVVAAPGAGIFKDDWVVHFSGQNTVASYDNDETGDRGALAAAEKLGAENVQFLCWPEARPTGWDIRDYFSAAIAEKLSLRTAFEDLEKLIRPQHRHFVPKSSELTMTGPPLTFEQLLVEFAKFYEIDDDFRRGLAISLATVLTTPMPHDPVWMYIIAPPSGGKTQILISLQHSTRTVFYSSFTPKSLVSGWGGPNDPSVLPKLNGKTAVFKDGTELVSMHKEAKAEIYGTLRGAFDGFVQKPFGSGVFREFATHFSVLMGMTDQVHADLQSAMGERFLKFSMRSNKSPQAKLNKSISSVALTEDKEQGELSKKVSHFLERKITRLPELSAETAMRIGKLAQVVAFMRATVERNRDGIVAYRPRAELPLRIAKQLTKLGYMLAVVLDRPSVDGDIWKYLWRIGMDTSIGYHVDIVRALVKQGKPMSTTELSRTCNIPMATILVHLDDMVHLTILEKQPAEPPNPATYKVYPKILSLWQEARGLTVDRTQNPLQLTAGRSLGVRLGRMPENGQSEPARAAGTNGHPPAPQEGEK